MSTTPNSQFYVVGGTVNPDSPSYVVRKADQELYDRLLAGEFCYVLTSRQMGKSSLMARTARRLTEEAKIHTAVVDLTLIGNKSEAGEWYYGIAHRILRELKLRDVNLTEWWQSRAQLPALQRLTEFFRDLLLEKITGQIVIFIDEIDSTISLPFTDDFFAAIRACHNARATDAAYNRLSFVLLGVASPSDLVKDATRTPFNVGQRIELTDFTIEEAVPLLSELSEDLDSAADILAAILYWTNGHPYLTQKLCRAVQYCGLDRINGSMDIHSIIENNFFSETASKEDYNLVFIRDWMKGDKSLTAKIFRLYYRVRCGEVITDVSFSMVHNRLKLSGLVAVKSDRTFFVRNRVYERVFTAEWAKKEIPADWNWRKVVNRQIVIALLVNLVVIIVSLYAVVNPIRYINSIRVAMDDYPGQAYESLHCFPWYRDTADESMAQLWERRAKREEYYDNQEGALLYWMKALEVKSSEARRSNVARLIVDYEGLVSLLRDLDPILGKVAFSTNGKFLVVARGREMYWLETETGQLIGNMIIENGFYSQSSIAISNNGKQILMGGIGGMVQQWNPEKKEMVSSFLASNSGIFALAISSNDKQILSGSDDGLVRLWNAETGQQIGIPLQHGASIRAVAFSFDGKYLLTGGVDGKVRLWSTETGKQMGLTLSLNWYSPLPVLALAFNTDGTRILTSNDFQTQVWDIKTGKHIEDIDGYVRPDAKRKVEYNVVVGTYGLWNLQEEQTIGASLIDDPGKLLRDWQRKFGVVFDPNQNYKLVPLYPVESSRTTSSPFN